jgi:hypothetical protein
MRHPKGNDKINYVIDFIFDMCDAPFQVYMSFLWPALMEALITYYALDMVQIFTRYVKPPGIYRQMRGSPHSKGDKKKPKPRTWRRYWRSFSNFDPNNAVADLTPNDGFFPDRQVTPGVRTLWTLYDIEQRTMYWIMCYEIAEEFFYKWSTGVANSRYCKEQYRPWVMATFTTDGNVPIVPETPIVIEEVVKARHGAFAFGNGAAAPGRGSIASFSCRMSPSTPPDAIRPNQKVLIRHSSGVVAEGNAFGAPGGTSVASASTTAEGLWTFYLVGSFIYLVDTGNINVIGMENYIDTD